MKKLSEGQIERLNCLIEECSEVVQSCTKILRFGFESTHPRFPNGQNNREHLEEELGNLFVILGFLVRNEDVDEKKIEAHEHIKEQTIGKYLRFQE